MNKSPDALNDCPLCRLAAFHYLEESGDYVVQCERCGTFMTSDAARVMLDALPLRYLVALTRAAHVSAAEGKTLHVTLQNVALLVAPYL